MKPPLVIGLARLTCYWTCDGADEREHELTLNRLGVVKARCLVCGSTEGYAMPLAVADPARREYVEASA